MSGDDPIRGALSAGSLKDGVVPCPHGHTVRMGTGFALSYSTDLRVSAAAVHGAVALAGTHGYGLCPWLLHHHACVRSGGSRCGGSDWYPR